MPYFALQICKWKSWKDFTLLTDIPAANHKGGESGVNIYTYIYVVLSQRKVLVNSDCLFYVAACM